MIGSALIVGALALVAQLPFAFHGMNNPYAEITGEICDLLKKRFKHAQKRGRLAGVRYKTYEDRVFRMLPYVSLEDVERGYTKKRTDWRKVLGGTR